jgi:hypothetical protein
LGIEERGLGIVTFFESNIAFFFELGSLFLRRRRIILVENLLDLFAIDI